jgi:hypothetical protein
MVLETRPAVSETYQSGCGMANLRAVWCDRGWRGSLLKGEDVPISAHIKSDKPANHAKQTFS